MIYKLHDIIIVLPGITGSVLQKNGKDVWAISGQAICPALKSKGRSIQGLKLLQDNHALDDLEDGVRATRLMPDIHYIPGLAKIDGYSQITKMIRQTFDVIEGQLDDQRPANFYEFPYDWRRDNRVAARLLKGLIDRQLPIWRHHCGADDARVILVAHSMGGLISRYYLEVLEGWRDCKALFTLGTPYRGSFKALNFLANGYKKLFGIVDLTEVMGSFTSVYQLLPIYEALNVNNSYRRVAEISDIPGVVRSRAEDALAFHREIEAAVNCHRQNVAYLENGYKLIPFVGTRQPTLQSAKLAGGCLTTSRVLPDWMDPRLNDGDGTVPYVSAIPLEFSNEYRETFLPEQHGSLQCNGRALEDLQRLLVRTQLDLRPIRGTEVSVQREQEAAIMLDVDDLYLPEEPVELSAQVVDFKKDDCTLEAIVKPVGADADNSIRKTFERTGEWNTLTFDGLAPGLYRVEVRATPGGPSAPTPVHDIFEVAEADVGAD